MENKTETEKLTEKIVVMLREHKTTTGGKCGVYIATIKLHTGAEAEDVKNVLRSITIS